MSVLFSLMISYGIGMIPLSQFILGMGYHRRMGRYPGVAGRRVLEAVIDILKGMLATYIGLHLGGWIGASLSALGVVLGHTYPLIMLKGVNRGSSAVAAGALFVLSPLVITIGLIVFLVSLLLTRYVTFSTLLTIPVVVLVTLFLSAKFLVVTITFCLAGVILFRERNSVKRWRRGAELPFRFK